MSVSHILLAWLSLHWKNRPVVLIIGANSLFHREESEQQLLEQAIHIQ